MTTSPVSWINQIDASGYHLTLPRRKIVEIIYASEHAMTAAEIFIKARTLLNGIGIVTVYRTLEKLEELNLVERVHHESGCHAYFAHVDGHQHLLLCRICHRVEYFSGDDLSVLEENISRRSGFEVEEHWLQLMGICPDCQLINTEKAGA
jgi:Fur family ferric uptake transcriptional regulator